MYLSHVYLYLCSRHHFIFMFSDSDLSIYMIYCRSFNFLYVTCHCRYLHAWTTSLDHVHCDFLSTPTGFIICTCEIDFWQPWILMSRSWSLDRGGLTVPDQSGATKTWISSCLSGPSFFQPPHDRLTRFSSYYSWVLSRISYCTSCFCASLWSYILEILYHNCVLVLLLLECILPLCFRTLILACTDAQRIYMRVFSICVFTSQ